MARQGVGDGLVIGALAIGQTFATGISPIMTGGVYAQVAVEAFSTVAKRQISVPGFATEQFLQFRASSEWRGHFRVSRDEFGQAVAFLESASKGAGDVFDDGLALSAKGADLDDVGAP